MNSNSFSQGIAKVLRFVGLVACLLAHPLFAQSTNFVIAVTNPPQGGTITGAGAYPQGQFITIATLAITSSPAWYINKVVLDPSVGYFVFGPRQQTLINQGGDITTITNDVEDPPLPTNMTVTVTFLPISPVILAQPTNQTLPANGSVMISAFVSARWPVSYQWQFNGTNIAGATNTSLSFAAVDQTNAGSYVLTATNAYGGTNSAPATLTVEEIVISTNGMPVIGSSVSSIGPIQMGLASLFPGGDIFYTLDGSEPDFNGNQYYGPFMVFSSCTLRAIAYSEDFFDSAESQPFSITVIPTYFLNAYAPGGGTVLVTPESQTGNYESNSTVTVIAEPLPGWEFMGWSGDLTGVALTNSVVMNGPKSIGAIFGTTLNTTVAGSGTVFVFPGLPPFPYGSTVSISALPNAGNYFGLWGNAASGRENPLQFAIWSPTQTVSALFATLPGNEVALTVFSQGGGSASASPSTNRCPLGSSVVLTATPVSGQQFLGWSGSVTGTTNPLRLTMDASKTVIANFSRMATISLNPPLDGPVVLSVSGVLNVTYRIEATTNLSTWAPLATATNFFGTLQFVDPAAQTTPCRMYRAVAP
jgi:hypothetical protein